MAQLVRDDERMLVFRVEPGKIGAGALAAAIGLAVCFGLIGEADGWGLDRLFEIGCGLVVLWAGLLIAGPEDLWLNLERRTYRLRTGLLWLARWREGPLEDLSHLELRKEGGDTAWAIRLVWHVPRRRPFKMESLRDTGADGKDPRLVLARRMEERAARFGIPARDETGAPLALSPAPADDPRAAAAAVLGAAAELLPGARGRLGEAAVRIDEAITRAGAAPVPPAPAPVPALAEPGAPVEVRTRRYRLAGSGGRLLLSKSRWSILEQHWTNVLWAGIAGPTLGYILLRARVWKVIPQLPRMLGQAGLLPGSRPDSSEVNPQGALVLFLFAAGAVGLLVVLCLAAWAILLRSAWRVARGETFVFAGDRLSYNGRELARIEDIRSVEVRGHEETDDDSTRSWHALCVILADDRRITLAFGEREEMARLGLDLAGCLGVEAVTR